MLFNVYTIILVLIGPHVGRHSTSLSFLLSLVRWRSACFHCRLLRLPQVHVGLQQSRRVWHVIDYSYNATTNNARLFREGAGGSVQHGW